MTKSFTPNDLVRYIYQEMSEEENESLVQALQENEFLMQEYIDMLSTLDQLNELRMSPSENTLKAVMRAASHFKLEKV
jgi:hypothetical protein